MNNQQTKKHSSEHHKHPHAEDDCDGCQNERKQNTMLVDFYQRLTNIESKVDKIKESLGTQQQQAVTNKRKIDHIASILLTKPQKAIQQIKLHNSKQMGYELASALIQREIKAKLQNQRLQAIIQQLKNDKKKLEEQKQKNSDANITSTHSQTQSNTPKKNILYEPSNSRYADSIDKVRRTNSIDSTFFAAKQKDKAVNNSYFPQDENKKYWSTSEAQVDTSFSNFGSVSKKQKSQNQYIGLNLWLYDFKPEQLDDNPIKSLRRPNKAQKRLENRNLHSKF